MTGQTTANGNSSLEIAQSNQDLIMQTKGKRKKRTWIIAGVACVVVLALIVAAIVLLSNEKKQKSKYPKLPEAEALSLDDVIYGKLNPKSFNATWVTGNELLYVDENRNLVKFNVETKNKSIVLPSSDELLQSAFEFKVSADKKFLLVTTDYQKIYRHSFRARHTVVELGGSGGRWELRAGSSLDLQLVVWAPVGNALAFVFDNSIYYRKSANEGEPVLIATGSPVVYNGIPDWVYEEEVFSSNTALWFSPDGKKLAYGRFNDTKTPLMVLPIYGDPGNPIFQYPRANVIRYPKAGTPNPDVSLHLVELENPSEGKVLSPPDDLVSREPILSTVVWNNKETVSAIWMNRVQNQASIMSYSAKEPFTPSVTKKLKQNGGWLELFTAPVFSEDGSKLAIILSQDQGRKLGSYRHLTLIATDESQDEPLTKGAYVVTELLGWDHKNDLIYYLANTAEDSSVQHLYSISPKTRTPKCLSCDTKANSNKTCTYNTAEFSPDFTNYALTCAGPDVPEINIYSSKNVKLLAWEQNKNLLNIVRQKRIPVTKKMEFNISDGFTARVSLKLPPNMDMSGNTKYPMLVNVYGGPDSFQVIDRFGLDWGSYLVTNKGIIYALIDGRGSGLRGDNLLFAGYRHLGTVEIADQINVTRSIQDTLPYVDASRTAIWGWSYGGYASGMALAEDKNNVFKCGISVAPVTDWALYDSIYTERFMGLPKESDNARGYIESQLLLKYEGLRNKQYFLIHGTYDDNVHYQQSMLWAKVLEQKDILFRQLSYPDEDHGLASVRPHLYHSLEHFLDECFLEKEEE
ncbi:unnamed protein product [Brassicogethes aeneus]|uniref:Venom dipeptidyl peptidase 4 n=1 Tax=Brassicogethes aeneus TaxID=1431903 RepID=A0A9P0FKU6_BRAAE|nr:unnamed protein product [Brassicogethes aeneus]